MGNPPSVLQVGTGITDGSGDATITFDKEFDSAPKIFIQAIDASSQGIIIDVVSVSTTQAVVKAKKIASSAGGHSHIALKGGNNQVYDTNGRLTQDGQGSTQYVLTGNANPSNVVTDTASAHSHSGTVLAIDFNWLAVLV